MFIAAVSEPHKLTSPLKKRLWYMR
jgi:hypothetical protein